jgi:putative ABC transport system permease protein
MIRAAIQALEGAPGVESVTMSGNGAVLVGRNARVSLPGKSGEPIDSRYNEAAPRYFETLGIRVLRGREFDSRDGLHSQPVAIVSESLARRMWPEGGAAGATVLIDARPHQVVGIVNDVYLPQRGAPLEPEVYTPAWQNPVVADARVAVRVKGDPAAMLSTLAPIVSRVDPAVPASQLMTLSSQIKGGTQSLRITATFVSYAAVLAILLSGIGLYGVMAFSVSRRTREIGIRMSLGARNGEVLAMVIREGMTAMLAGIVAGIWLAIAASRLVRHLLYGPNDADPPVYAAAVLTVAAAGLIACWFPARRASKVDPMAALSE